MKKIVYISSIAAPHQIKLCAALNAYFDAEFWFYDSLGARASWWAIPLGEKCKILDRVPFKRGSKFITWQHLEWLRTKNPDVVLLGGFSIPANYLAYRWAKRKDKKVIVFTERSRDRQGKLRKRGLVWILLRWLYRKVDMVMVSEEDIVPQFRDEFGFGQKVVASRYAADIDNYLAHPLRRAKSAYTYMFPNRLTANYGPLDAIHIFHQITQFQQESRLVMNALGEQRAECAALIASLGLVDRVQFLDHISSWERLHEEYRECDILIFPAKFSNGNFTIIEAMASGMGIVISQHILGVGTYIQDGVNGFRIPLANELFVSAVKTYIENPELLLAHATINREKVKTLGPAGTAKLYDELIQTLF